MVTCTQIISLPLWGRKAVSGSNLFFFFGSMKVCADFMGVEDHSHCKRLPDGSKRIKVPDLFSPQVINS